MRKKGVSPIIATILLVALVVAIAAIAFIWLRGLIPEATTKFGQNTELVCDDVVLTATYLGNVLTISNDGTIPIYDVEIQMEGFGKSSTINIKDTSGEWNNISGLLQGERFSDNIASYVGQNVETMTATPVLLGKTDSGERKTQRCDQELHGVVVSL